MDKLFFLFLLLVALIRVHFANSSIESLASVIRCATGLDYLRMFDTYNSYGCWCGVGGSGETVDEIDKCCQTHDKCWASSTCSWFQKYFGPTYKFKCLDKSRHQTTLKKRSSEKHRKKKDQSEETVKGVPQCVWNEEFDICAMQLCSCDRSFAECLAKLPVPSAKRECDGQWRPVEDKMPTEKHKTTKSTDKAAK
ncbi:hypothetical protein niasHT_032088 [Heterodera trifolii]|uniref:Phospholipase A2 n=1 Tax=Heterodera trifolii TaxID=157864 RepID=A0ABD2IF67_9BILA